MEEKERFECKYNEKLMKHYTFDNENKEELGYKGVVRVLNQQLKEQLNYYKGTKLGDFAEEIRQLKQSQNEKAIKVLEMMIEEIRSLNMPNKPELYNNDMFATGFESHYLGVERIINNQIKSLKGEE